MGCTMNSDMRNGCPSDMRNDAIPHGGTPTVGETPTVRRKTVGETLTFFISADANLHNKHTCKAAVCFSFRLVQNQHQGQPHGRCNSRWLRVTAPTCAREKNTGVSCGQDYNHKVSNRC